MQMIILNYIFPKEMLVLQKILNLEIGLWHLWVEGNMSLREMPMVFQSIANRSRLKVLTLQCSNRPWVKGAKLSQTKENHQRILKWLTQMMTHQWQWWSTQQRLANRRRVRCFQSQTLSPLAFSVLRITRCSWWIKQVKEEWFAHLEVLKVKLLYSKRISNLRTLLWLR